MKSYWTSRVLLNTVLFAQNLRLQLRLILCDETWPGLACSAGLSEHNALSLKARLQLLYGEQACHENPEAVQACLGFAIQTLYSPKQLQAHYSCDAAKCYSPCGSTLATTSSPYMYLSSLHGACIRSNHMQGSIPTRITAANCETASSSTC